MTYFRKRIAYYHWRGSVSPSCSGWEGVVPLCYGRQTKGGRRFYMGWLHFLANTVYRYSKL
jgi:hypothetical protein